MTKAFLPQMKAKNHGHIVTIASALGLFSTACVEVKTNDFLNHKLNTRTDPTTIHLNAHDAN